MDAMAVEVLIYAVAGFFGGLVRILVSGEGVLILPKTYQGRIDLGFLSSLIIGAIAGSIAPHAIGVNSVIAFFAGYVGNDLLENLAERALKHRGETT